MLDGTVLDPVGSINDLGVIMDEKMTLSEHVNAKAFAMLGFIRRLSLEFRDPCTVKSLYTSLVRPKPEYASSVWSPFYNVHVDRVERVCVVWGWTDIHDLPPYEDRCVLLHSYKKAVDCLCDVYFRCSEWESELAKLVGRSRFDYTAISDSWYRVSAY
jgi:hypothetical protein